MQRFLIDYKVGSVRTNSKVLSLDFNIPHQKVVDAILEIYAELAEAKFMFKKSSKDSDIWLINRNGFTLLYTTIFKDKKLILKTLNKFDSLEKEFCTEDVLVNRALTIVNEQREKLIVENYVMKSETSQAKQINDYKSFVENSKAEKPTWLVAKDYGWDEARFVQFLNDNALTYKIGNTLMLMDPYLNKGYAVVVQEPYRDEHGYNKTRVGLEWTRAGRLYIYELMKKNGTLPLCERGDTQ